MMTTRISTLAFLCAASLAAAIATTPAAAQDFDCKGLNFVFFPGGPEGGPFASIVYNGAKAAADMTGCRVDYVWSEWNPEKMVTQFREAIARRPDGISIMGHPGEAALGPLIDQARKQGIIVTTANVDLPKYESQYKADGFGYAGQKLYDSGFNLGQATFGTCKLAAGDKVLVWGLLGQPGRGQRTQGIVDALEKAGAKVIYLEISDEINKDAAQGAPSFSSLSAANPDLKAAVTDHGALTATQGLYHRAAGKKPGEICGAGFDLSAPTAQAIKEGWVSVVLDQQPFLQGFLPVMQLYLTKKFGFAGMNIDTGAALITKANVEQVAPLAEKAIR
ncbi:MAG: substrate-binding domain-containing protein [Rhodospirillales bacterium]|nr:substrate-binding domain-containing protein [Rhodospirillales bacterium]